MWVEMRDLLRSRGDSLSQALISWTLHQVGRRVEMPAPLSSYVLRSNKSRKVPSTAGQGNASKTRWELNDGPLDAATHRIALYLLRGPSHQQLLLGMDIDTIGTSR